MAEADPDFCRVTRCDYSSVRGFTKDHFPFEMASRRANISPRIAFRWTHFGYRRRAAKPREATNRDQPELGRGWFRASYRKRGNPDVDKNPEAVVWT